ncbi:MAG: hypothetical protein HY861_03165 [Chlamydiia bacterium]|nr:hypothetical protein [Chlamydiia bacterium]
MYSALEAVAEGIQEMASANADAEQASAMNVLAGIGTLAPLQEAWDQILQQDEAKYYAASLGVLTDPSKAALAASYQAQMSADTSASDSDTNTADTALQTAKSETESEGNFMTQIFSALDPISQLLQAAFSGSQQV